MPFSPGSYQSRRTRAHAARARGLPSGFPSPFNPGFNPLETGGRLTRGSTSLKPAVHIGAPHNRLGRTKLAPSRPPSRFSSNGGGHGRLLPKPTNARPRRLGPRPASGFPWPFNPGFNQLEARVHIGAPHGSTLVTSNLPFDEWTSILGSERLTGALLDRLTHHVHILEMNGQSYRLATSKKAQPRSAQGQSQKTKIQNEGGPSPSFKSTQKHNHKPGLQSPFPSTRLVQYLAAIWHILSPPLTRLECTSTSFSYMHCMHLPLRRAIAAMSGLTSCIAGHPK
jgi:IstB-like ATP binding protein